LERKSAIALLNIGVVVKKVEALLGAANSIFRQEGLSALLRRSFIFLVERFYWSRSHYIFEYDAERLEDLNENDFMPKSDGFEFRVVSAADQASGLAMEIVDSGWHRFRAKDALQRGAIACFTLVGNELAHVMWVAPNERARDYMRFTPISVDPSQGEYCASGWTNPKYRRMNFARYTSVKAVQALKERGLTKDRYTVNKRNVPSLQTFGRFESRLCAEARYMKLLWWRFWREWPIDSWKAD
jgi:ribosomal protein S18 acetylase RimI-like enzyme